ncbi:MAG: fibronectin type III domain-containing protein, partial [Chloroflexi bacterium]|nr:fibronectin type III domain-containing protein [Chloroflexota bacterium]
IELDAASKNTYVWVKVSHGLQGIPGFQEHTLQEHTHLVIIDPPPRTYTLSPRVSVTEGEQAALTLSLGSPAGAGGVSFTVSADYPDGGATAEDVGQFPATVTVPEGQRSARVIIPTVDDEAIEEDEERFTVRVAHVGEPAWAVDPEGTDTAVVTIVDNDEPPEGPEPWNIRVVPGDGTLTVTWNISSRDGFEDSEIRHALRWSQVPAYAQWNNPRDPRAVGRNDGVHVPPGETEYVITDLENGVTTGVMVRSFTGHRNNMSERDPTSSKWVHVRGEHTTPVEPPNAAPAVSAAIADATIVNESGMHDVSLSGVFSDADGDALTITAASSDTAVATVSVAADYSTLTVSAQARGTATITVTAADGYGGEVEDSLTVTVKAAPAVASAIADISGLVAEDSRTISMSGVFSDADGDAVTVTQASSSDTSIAAVSAAIDGSTAAITAVTVTAGSEGTATIRVTAQDADGNTVQDAFDVTVNAAAQQLQKANNPPTVSSAMDDATIVNESGTHEASLSGVFSDADGDDLTITASSSDENVATVSVSADHSTLTVTAQARGTATITVTAADGYGGTVEDNFTLTVKAAPVVAAAIDDVSELYIDATHEVALTDVPSDADAEVLTDVFTDADGDALTITAESSDTEVLEVATVVDESTRTVTGLTVTGVAEGTATVTVTAEDPDGNQVSDEFDVTVVESMDSEFLDDEAVPGPVASLTLTADGTKLIVSWEAPAPESGGEVRGYIVHLKPEGGGKGRTKTPKAKKTQVSFENLEAGQTYKVWVRAQNAAGKGERVHASITLP